jgi:hypothetical protein
LLLLLSALAPVRRPSVGASSHPSACASVDLFACHGADPLAPAVRTHRHVVPIARPVSLSTAPHALGLHLRRGLRLALDHGLGPSFGSASRVGETATADVPAGRHAAAVGTGDHVDPSYDHVDPSYRGTWEVAEMASNQPCT